MYPMHLQLVKQHNILKNTICFCIASLLPLSAMAYSIGPYKFRPLLTLTGGYAITSATGYSQQYLFSDDAFFNVNAGNVNAHEGMVGLFAGGEYQLQPQFALQLGLAYYQPSPFVVRDTETQGILVSPETYDSYSYHYSMNLRQLLVESKLLYSCYNLFHPFFSLGLGAAFNSSYNYQINNPPFLTFAPQFTNNNTSNFSYRIGVGIDVDATDNLRIGLGYHFADFGKTYLGSGSINTTGISGTLKQSTIYVNEVVAQVTLIV